MGTTGVIEVTLKLFLDRYVDEDEAREIVENMKYSVKHPAVEYTEIMADDITQRCSEN